MKCATGHRRATDGESFWGLFAALLLALSLVAAGGCTDGGEAGGCDDCQQGCCQNGTCIAPGNMNDSACGFGGMSCSSCIAQGKTCNTGIGQCMASVTPVTSDPIVGSCNPACDTFTQTCVSGLCQPINTDPVAGTCSPACNSATEVCMGGVCEPIGGNNNNNSGNGCVACNPPNQCYDGRCVDAHSYCRSTCTGCCNSRGVCLPIGDSAGQSADQCGKDGQQCMSCLSARLDCNTARGECGNANGGKLRICAHSAMVDGDYDDADCKLPWSSGKDAPEVYIRFQVGGEVLATMAYGAVGVESGAYWNIGWGGQCVEVEIKDAYTNGIDVVAYDKDSGACAGDDYIGKCKANPSGWSLGYGSKFSLGEGRCEGHLKELWLEVLPQL